MNMASYHFKKPPFSATICLVIACSILASLSYWQVQRLEWKAQWLAAIEAAYNPQNSLPDLAIADFNDKTQQAHTLFKRGVIEARVIDEPLLLIPRTNDGVSGAHALYPARLKTDDIILINAGFLKQNDTVPRLNNQTFRFIGSIRAADSPNVFTPENNIQSGRVFYIDYDEITGFYALDKTLPESVFYVDTDFEKQGALTPHAQDWRPSNNHKSYAIFWFLTLLTLVGVFTARFVLVKRSTGTVT
jgi:surfeit locus 1 family protein